MLNRTFRTLAGIILSFLPLQYSLLISSCGSGRVQTPVPANQPTFAHVVLVVEENHSFSDVIGNSSMPYINSLAQQYGVAAQYFANAHPSLPNYLMLTTGKIETFDDNFGGVIGDDNVFKELTKENKTWKVYAENLPRAGYLGGDSPPYVKRHNPAVYFSDVQNNPSLASNIVPFTQFASDLGNNALPQFAFVVPNVDDDAHNGTLPQADAWLNSNIAPLVSNPAFQASGLLMIVFDEAEMNDLDHGGGQVPAIIVSSRSKKNYTSHTFFQHQSTLRLALEASGVGTFPGAAATAPDMTEFFQ